MKKLLASTFAACLVCSAATLGAGVAGADEQPNPQPDYTGTTTLNIGGAKVPFIIWQKYWYDWTFKMGRGYFPGSQTELVDYPAGQIQGHLLEEWLPGSVLNGPSVGESVVIGRANLDGAIRRTPGHVVPIGLSEGTLVLDAEQSSLAWDPTAPPPSDLTFTYFGDPGGRHAFGQGIMPALFGIGQYIPVVDYTMPLPIDSQYDTNKVVTAYDGIADFPDRPDNHVSVLNSLFGAAFGHTPVAMTTRDQVPPQNISTTTNWRGGTTTTYLVPNKHLPLTLPLRELGVDPSWVDQLDALLQPMVDAGYKRNDNPLTAPYGVHPIGLDPLAALSNLDTSGGDFNAESLLSQVDTMIPAILGDLAPPDLNVELPQLPSGIELPTMPTDLPALPVDLPTLPAEMPQL